MILALAMCNRGTGRESVREGAVVSGNVVESSMRIA